MNTKAVSFIPFFQVLIGWTCVFWISPLFQDLGHDVTSNKMAQQFMCKTDSFLDWELERNDWIIVQVILQQVNIHADDFR